MMRKKKTIFLNAMPLDIGFHLRRNPVADLTVAQNGEISLEDDLITTGKWRKDVQTPNMQPSTSSNPVIKCLMNDVIALKRQLPKTNPTYQQPYQDIGRRQFNQPNSSRLPQLPTAQPRLAIEAPPRQTSMCVFHLTTDHDGATCPDMQRFLQMEATKDTLGEMTVEERASGVPGDSGTYFLEQDSYFERGGDILVTLEDPSCAILTRNQKATKTPFRTFSSIDSAHEKDKSTQKTLEDPMSSDVKILPKVSSPSTPLFSPFNIVELCKASTIKISPAECLRLNPKELDKLVKYVRDGSQECTNGQKFILESFVSTELPFSTLR